MKIKSSFEHMAELWDAKTKNSGNISDQTNIKAILKLTGNLKGKNVYEIACGNGYLSRKIKKAGAKEVYASDASPTLIHFAETKYENLGIKFSTREGADATKLPKKFFDAVIIHQGIFYIKDIPKLMKAIASILKTDGKVIFTVTHPLYQVFRAKLGLTKLEGKNSLIETLEKYPKNFTKPVHKHWLVNSKVMVGNYFAYSRPLEYYVEQCAKAGLLIEAIKETPSMGRKDKLRIIKSPMPSSFVIKAIKVK